MRRVLVVLLTVPLLVALIEPNAIAKKRSRSGRAAVHSRRESRGKAAGFRVAHVEAGPLTRGAGDADVTQAARGVPDITQPSRLIRL